MQTSKLSTKQHPMMSIPFVALDPQDAFLKDTHQQAQKQQDDVFQTEPFFSKKTKTPCTWKSRDILNQSVRSYQEICDTEPEEDIEISPSLSPSFYTPSLYKKTRFETENPNQFFKKRNPNQIEIRSLGNRRPIPVINTSLNGSHLINSTPELMDYCLKWCKSVYHNRAVFRAVHNTGTLLFIIPGGRFYFIQFLYGKEMQSDYQKAFQSQIFPEPVLIIRSFQSFCSFVKSKDL